MLPTRLFESGRTAFIAPSRSSGTISGGERGHRGHEESVKGAKAHGEDEQLDVLEYAGGDQDRERCGEQGPGDVGDQEQQPPREPVDDCVTDEDEHHEGSDARGGEPGESTRAVGGVKDQQGERDQGDAVTEVRHGLAGEEERGFAAPRQLSEGEAALHGSQPTVARVAGVGSDLVNVAT
jgi:hypothetical protein